MITINIDLGSAQEVKALVMFDHNLTSAATIVLNADDIFALTENMVITGFSCNLSLVNGTAFISNPSVDLTPYVGHKITLTAGGKTLIGYIKAAGTGETIGSEISTDPGFDNDAAWNKDAGWSVAGNKAVALNSAEGNAIYQNVIIAAAGKLYKFQITADLITDGSFYMRLGGVVNGIIRNAAGTHTDYFVDDGNANGLIFLNSAVLLSGTFDDFSVKQVLTPSATGVRIVSTLGGATYNWASDDGINPNATSFTATISPYLEESIPWAADKILHYLSAATTKRYWRLKIDDIVNPDGYIDIGELSLGPYMELSKNYIPGFQKGITLLSDSNKTPYGVRKNRFYNRQRQFDYSFNGLTVADLALLEAMVDGIANKDAGTLKPFFFNDDPAITANTWLINFDELPETHRVRDWYITNIRGSEVMRSI